VKKLTLLTVKCEVIALRSLSKSQAEICHIQRFHTAPT
jgi:hypothetical protein